MARIMNQDIGNRWLSAIRKRGKKIAYFCSAENVPPNFAVHEIRKSLKAIRALLKMQTNPVLREYFKAKMELLAEMGRTLSSARESHVNVTLFDQISETNDLVDRRKMKEIKSRLDNQNRKLIHNIFAGRKIIEKVCLVVHELVSAKELAAYRSLEREEVSNLIINIYNKSFSMYQGLSPESGTEEFHELRKKMKILGYQLEFLQFLNPKYFKGKYVQIKKGSELLGDHHDLEVFRGEMQKQSLLNFIYF